MRAWQVKKAGEPREVLEIEDVAPPEPPPGMLRVRVEAAGVGLPDVLMCRGSYPLTPGYPFSPGQELVGTVTGVGEGAPANVGDRVMAVSGFYLGHGGFAREVSRPRVIHSGPLVASSEVNHLWLCFLCLFLLF